MTAKDTSMKYKLLTLIFCVACTQGSVAKRMTDREREGLIGPAKKVFVGWSPISPDPNIPAGSRCRVETDVYDESGRLMQHSVYGGICGGDETREDYNYEKDGSRTTKLKRIREKDGPPAEGMANPNWKEEKGEPRDVFKYDASGKLIEEASTMPGGRVLYKTTYIYDARGRMVEMDSGDGNGKPTRRVYSYTGDDRFPSGFQYIGGDGRVYEQTSYSDYEFNSQGDWIKRMEMTEETVNRTFNRKSVSWMFREIELPVRKMNVLWLAA
jgi:hypothetical protein